MRPLVHGGGGTTSAAVASLYERLGVAVSLSRRSRTAAGPARADDGEREDRERRERLTVEPILVMAPDSGVFASVRARITQPLDGVDVIIATSGSTDGRGHLVGLSLDALVASARATLDRLGGPGQWVTSLPIHGVAGFQVVLRSVLAGRRPVVYAPRSGFDGAAFEAAVTRLDPGERAYLSLVPTQLHRALDAAPDALARFDAVLIGGAALTSALAARARDAGVSIVTTYGSTETSGGCVYDGIPLDGVEATLDGERIHIAGTTLMTRYLDTPDQPFDHHGRLITPDLGALDGDRLRILGRADDVLISGGVNIHPRIVEEALAPLAGDWVVVGVPDPEWGQRLVAVTTGEANDEAMRAAVASLPPAARPKQLLHCANLPVRPTGKVDRRALAAWVQQAADRPERTTGA